MIDTYLFDIDGTLLDTRDFILSAAEHSLQTHGFAIPERAVMSPHVGKSFHDFYFAFTGADDTLHLQETHRQFQLENLHLSVPFEGALETLQMLKQHGAKIAAVTSRFRKTSMMTLDQAGLSAYIDTVICGDDSVETKPSPVPLLLALEQMGKKPEHAIMIGDSHFDVEAGKNAGTKTVRATYGFHTDNLNDPKPDHFIDAIGELLVLEW